MSSPTGLRWSQFEAHSDCLWTTSSVLFKVRTFQVRSAVLPFSQMLACLEKAGHVCAIIFYLNQVILMRQMS